MRKCGAKAIVLHAVVQLLSQGVSEVVQPDHVQTATDVQKFSPRPPPVFLDRGTGVKKTNIRKSRKVKVGFLNLSYFRNIFLI